MDLRFNKKNTKYLIKSSVFNEDIDKRRLDWLLENKKVICGTIYKRLFKKVLFLIEKNIDKYRLITCIDNQPYIYMINDIDKFLEYIYINELIMENEETVHELLDDIKNMPSTGLIITEDEKIFLYDNKFIEEV